MTTTNFDSGSLVTNDGVTSATYSGWTFGASSAIDFANASAADLTALLNQSGGRSIVLNYNGANVTNFYFKSSDGSDLLGAAATVGTVTVGQLPYAQSSCRIPLTSLLAGQRDFLLLASFFCKPVPVTTRLASCRRQSFL